MGLENITCFRCDRTGHIAADCDELKPATSKDEHEARIARYVARWMDGEIADWQKRQAIAAENKMWYGDKCRTELRKA